MNQCTPDRFLHSRTHHTKGSACRGDWYGSSESGSPRIPRPAILRTDMSYLHSTFIHTHIHSHTGISWWKLWNWTSQLFLTDDNGKYFHLSRVLMVPKLQKWWNVEEKIKYLQLRKYLSVFWFWKDWQHQLKDQVRTLMEKCSISSYYFFYCYF